jgi:hypothetical protein
VKHDGGARVRRLSPTRTVVVLGLAALVLAAALLLTRSAPRRAGTNFTEDLGYAIHLLPGQQLCEPGELVPGDTAGVMLDASAGTVTPSPPLAVTISGAGVASSGALRAGWRQGWVRIPVQRIANTTGGTVCVRDAGAVPVSFGGSVPDGSFVVSIDGQGLGGRLRIEYERPGSESWLSLLPTLAHRFDLDKSKLVRDWAAVGALLLMLCAIALAVRTVLAQEREA